MEWSSIKALGWGSIHSRVAPRSLSSWHRHEEKWNVKNFRSDHPWSEREKGLAYISLPEIFHWITTKKVIHYIISRNFRKLFVSGKQPGVWAFNKLQKVAL